MAVKSSLTVPRLIVIERSLKHRMRALPPIAKDDRKHYEQALKWAREQRAQREKRAKKAGVAQ
jgi:hypothetical protein